MGGPGDGAAAEEAVGLRRRRTGAGRQEGGADRVRRRRGPAGGRRSGQGLQAAGGADVILSTTNSAKQISAAFAGLRPNGRFVNMGVPMGRS